MTIRWRLATVIVQLVLLGSATWLATGQPYSAATWFTAGLLSVIIGSQLLEPFYSRPVDVLANSILGVVIYLTTPHLVAQTGWWALLAALSLLLLLSLLAILFGAKSSEGRLSRIGNGALAVSRVATANVIWSVVFFLALVEVLQFNSVQFWILVVSWGAISWLGSVNWADVFAALRGTPGPCRVEAMIGPTTLIVTSNSLPPIGTEVRVTAGRTEVTGVLTTRLRKADGYWGQLHIPDSLRCEVLAGRDVVSLSTVSLSQSSTVGMLLEGSTDTTGQFLAIGDLSVGDVLETEDPIGTVYHQVRWAEVENKTVKGGAQQSVRVHVSQIGYLEPKSGRLTQYRWVSRPGGLLKRPAAPGGVGVLPQGVVLGHLNGTVIPVALDTQQVCQGHLAILGMTRMGKSTLARRLAAELAKTASVTVLDQTGEWVGKHQFTPYSGPADDLQTGLRVLEHKPGLVLPDEALKYLREIVKLAYGEYKSGKPLQRVLLIDEAHQYVPEPAGLGFNAPGRDSASAFGLLMMQVRKYGITIVLISQRTAVVAKSALSQCENVIAFKSVDQTGLEYLEAVLGSEAKKALPALVQGEALVSGPALSSDRTVGIVVSN